MPLSFELLCELHAALPQGRAAVEVLLADHPIDPAREEALLAVAIEAGHRDVAQWWVDRLGGVEAMSPDAVDRCLSAAARGPHPEVVGPWWEAASSYARYRALGDAVEVGHEPTLRDLLRLAQGSENRKSWERAMGLAIERGNLPVASLVLEEAPSALRALIQTKSVVEAVRHRRLAWILRQAPSVNLGLTRFQEAMELAMETRQESVVPWLLSQLTPRHDLSVTMKHAVQAERLDWLQPQLDLAPAPDTVTLALRAALYHDSSSEILPLLEALLPHTSAEAYKEAHHQGPLAHLHDAQGDDPKARPRARLLAHWLARTDPEILGKDMEHLLAYKSVHLYGEALSAQPSPQNYAQGIWKVLQRLEDLTLKDTEAAWRSEASEELQALLREWVAHSGPLGKRDMGPLERRFGQFSLATQQALVTHLGHGERPEWKAVARRMELEQRPGPAVTRPRRRP